MHLCEDRTNQWPWEKNQCHDKPFHCHTNYPATIDTSSVTQTHENQSQNKKNAPLEAEGTGVQKIARCERDIPIQADGFPQKDKALLQLRAAMISTSLYFVVWIGGLVVKEGDPIYPEFTLYKIQGCKSPSHQSKPPIGGKAVFLLFRKGKKTILQHMPQIQPEGASCWPKPLTARDRSPWSVVSGSGCSGAMGAWLAPLEALRHICPCSNWLWVKHVCPKWKPGIWKYGLNQRSPSGLILTHA